MIFLDQEYLTDAQGYLLDATQWNEDLAVFIADQEGLYMSENHWQIIHFVRDFYNEFNTSPAMRPLIKAMQQKQGNDKINSRYLYRLFPEGPAKQATKIAGLPKPARCI